MDGETVFREFNFGFGIYGWRKRCLYSLIFVLIITIVINLTFTLWMLKIMQFSSKGMGQLSITLSGLKLDGAAFVLSNLISSSIKSRTSKSITIESNHNLTLLSGKTKKNRRNKLQLGGENVECHTNNFVVSDDNGTKLLSINRTSVLLDVEKLTLIGEGGSTFQGSVQTTLVNAKTGHNLSLQSPTNSLKIKSSKDIVIESVGGKIEVIAPYSINLNSEFGAIHVVTSLLMMPKLKTAKTVRTKRYSLENAGVFQLCVCENGRMFAAASDSTCSTNNNICR